MVKIKSTNEIILNAIDFIRSAQPQADLKPGSCIRDLIIDAPSVQVARIYEELARIRTSQSLTTSLGIDLDRLGKNYGAIRKQGSKSSGSSLFTFNDIEADIPINKGDIVTANNGATFLVVNSITVSSVFSNTYRATASIFRSDLDFVGITDQFAVSVQLEATSVGVIGNISKYSLATASTPGVSNVTNAIAFGGGTGAEDDAAFRSRVLAIFSGSNTGTTLGYQNAAKSDPAVLDALVVGPGDSLMTRDGTQVTIAANGTRTIVSEGTGGKVDIYIYGTRLVEVLDSYVYQDKSNKNDSTDPKNDFVLGQITADAGKTVSKKRLDDIANGVLPNQPINDVISISGSSSGANFIQKQVDNLGRVTGNYELIRDTGSFAGSPWGFDTIHWIDTKISNFSEDLTKGRFNGQDSVTYTDVLEIDGAQQNIIVTNENSKVSPSDRTSIQLYHFPVTSVTRVFNLTTGERYVVSSQNPDGTGLINETGRIIISGSTLPSISDVLQVDYTWIFNYDANFDFDNKLTHTNPRSSVDSIDWGFSNAVRREQSTVVTNGSQLLVSVTHPISAVISVNTFLHEDASITLSSGRLAVIVSFPVTNIVSILRKSDLAELFDTSADNGSFSGFTIFLPTDTVAVVGNITTIIYNATDVFTKNGLSGSFDGYQITLSSSAAVTAGTLVECNYIANIRTLLPTTLLSSLPAIKNVNGFKTQSSSLIGCQPTTHIFSSPGVINQNLRQAPSRLQLSISGTISTGVITVSGTTFSEVFDSIITVSSDGFIHNLSSAIKNALNLSSIQSVPSNISVVRVIAVDKVTTTSSLDVLSVDHVYDVKGYKLKNNSFVKSESVIDTSLSQTEFELPSTPNNLSNEPKIGDRLRITFYFSTTSDSENVSFSKSGSLFTQKIFALVDTVSISSGFTSAASQTASLSISNQNQPASGTRYTATYDYQAPKNNERISIRYNHNQLINDSTFTIQDVRPISADVLVKAAVPILIDASLAIVVSSSFVSQGASDIVAQNIRDAVTAAINAQQLGTTLDSSDLINVAYTIQGLDRVRITFFNKTGIVGSALTITAANNEFLQANNVQVTVEAR